MKNRVFTREPSPDHGGWCGTCDMALVVEGARCRVCGKRDGRPKNRIHEAMSPADREELMQVGQ